MAAAAAQQVRGESCLIGETAGFTSKSTGEVLASGPTDKSRLPTARTTRSAALFTPPAIRSMKLWAPDVAVGEASSGFLTPSALLKRSDVRSLALSGRIRFLSRACLTNERARSI